MHWLFHDYAQATNTKDRQVLFAALAGFVLSIALLYYATRPTAPRMNKDTWNKFTLIKKIPLSPTTSIYRFKLRKGDSLNIPIGQHISVRAMINGRNIMRSYTPVSTNDTKDYFDLLVKSYPKGNVSRVFGELKIGDKLEMKGPKGMFDYHPNMADSIGMIAGGSGLTPCLQVLEAALREPRDHTKFSLLYANVSEDEILLRDRLDALAELHPSRFKVRYFLDRPPTDWEHGVGFISKDEIAKHLPPPHERNRVVMCGPPPMVESMKGHLAGLMHPKPNPLSKADDPVFIF
ncbi:cytochrome-b5 reductase [Malassezia vespertilionis]|uniref:NADH-cytochrome b5 reductase n=1 Tax=Malassezia vespertilionis TaxID=2020962 RepID=A0A2N1J800_9BASI|nr:cytochrome-b5 reductase [Malassezia vespertilionis]PKI82684.1 Cbr1p [Malassezia vespertilionis]WFD08449.1 cytochrome-b5 reductase [Malassezia vespertilionis]